MNIITGATGVTHVTSNNDGEFNQAIFGDDLVVLSNGNQLDAEIVNNNLIAVKDGDLVMQGRHALIEPGTEDEITISTGTVDTNRNDLIVARYRLDNLTGYESLTLEVIEGTESSGAAVDPDYTDGVIRTGATLVEYPLYRVRIEGINIVGLDKLFEPVKNIIDGVGEIGNTDISKIGDGTITGAIGSLSENLTKLIPFPSIHKDATKTLAWNELYKPFSFIATNDGFANIIAASRASDGTVGNGSISVEILVNGTSLCDQSIPLTTAWAVSTVSVLIPYKKDDVIEIRTHHLHSGQKSIYTTVKSNINFVKA